MGYKGERRCCFDFSNHGDLNFQVSERAAQNPRRILYCVMFSESKLKLTAEDILTLSYMFYLLTFLEAKNSIPRATW